MKKGFTLVELLAVIVILAVVSIITIPIVGNVIESSKKKALEQSAYGIVESARYFALTNNNVKKFVFNEETKGKTEDGKYALNYKGEIDATGDLYIDSEGNISFCLMNEEYYVYKNYNGGIYVGEVSEDTCIVGYDALTNKYVAMLDDGSGSISNVYSKDEVDSLLNKYALQSNLDLTNSNISNINTQVDTNTNDITNIKTQIGSLATTSNLETVNTLASNNQADIESLKSSVTSINSGLIKVDKYEYTIDSSYKYWYIPITPVSKYAEKKVVGVTAWSSNSLVVPYILASGPTYAIYGTNNSASTPMAAGTYYLSIFYMDK